MYLAVSSRFSQREVVSPTGSLSAITPLKEAACPSNQPVALASTADGSHPSAGLGLAELEGDTLALGLTDPLGLTDALGDCDCDGDTEKLGLTLDDVLGEMELDGESDGDTEGEVDGEVDGLALADGL